ncbi:MAG: hypothetical protein AB7O04_04020 [Hyphomonadaceae bacterium]
MRGQILGVDSARSVGVILAPDGARVEFPLAEWRSAGQPVAGQWVDYIAGEAPSAAVQVYALPNEAGAGARPASAVAATSSTLGTILGAIAIGCLLLGFAIPILPTIAALVLGIVGAARAKDEGDDTGLLLSRIGWIGAAVLLSLGVLLVFGAIVFFGGLMGMAGAMGWAWPFMHWT